MSLIIQQMRLLVLVIRRGFLLLLLNLKFMLINYILMRLLHYIFEICTLLHDVLSDHFFCKVADLCFMLGTKFTFCWACWRKVVLFSGTLDTVVIYMAQVVYNFINFSLSILVALHVGRASSFSKRSFWLLNLNLKFRKLWFHSSLLILLGRFCFLLVMYIHHLPLKKILELVFKISIMTPGVRLLPLKHAINILFKLQDFGGLRLRHLCQLLHAVIILLTQDEVPFARAGSLIDIEIIV